MGSPYYSYTHPLKLKTVSHSLTQKSNQGYIMTLNTPTTSNQCPYQGLTSYTLQFARYKPDKILKVKVTTEMSKVKSRSFHDVGYSKLPTNVPTKYQLPTPYSFNDMAWKIFYRPRSKVQSMPHHAGPHLHLQINVPTKHQLPTAYSFQNIARTRFYTSRSLQ